MSRRAISNKRRLLGSAAILCCLVAANCKGGANSGCSNDNNYKPFSGCGSGCGRTGCGSGSSSGSGGGSSISSGSFSSGSSNTPTCKSGTLSCDGPVDDENGCEVDSLNDRNNCGGCSSHCADSGNSVGMCQQGVCKWVCNESFADCDGSTGCKTSLSEIASCGACGRTCDTSCESAVCAPTDFLTVKEIDAQLGLSAGETATIRDIFFDEAGGLHLLTDAGLLEVAGGVVNRYGPAVKPGAGKNELVIDGEYAFLAKAEENEIHAVRLSDGTEAILATPSHPVTLSAGDGYVYFGDDFAVQRVPIAGGPAEVIEAFKGVFGVAYHKGRLAILAKTLNDAYFSVRTVESWEIDVRTFYDTQVWDPALARAGSLVAFSVNTSSETELYATDLASTEEPVKLGERPGSWAVGAVSDVAAYAMLLDTQAEIRRFDSKPAQAVIASEATPTLTGDIEVFGEHAYFVSGDGTVIRRVPR